MVQFNMILLTYRSKYQQVNLVTMDKMMKKEAKLPLSVNGESLGGGGRLSAVFCGQRSGSKVDLD